MSILQDLKDVSRLEHIASVLIKYELGYLVHSLKLKKHLPFGHRLKAIRSQPVSDHREAARRLVKVMEELGPTFIKLGQLLSLRSDLIPEVFCDEFRKLQDHVPPEKYETVRTTIERELGKPLPKIFSHFDKESVASASIAQVHRAKLKNGKVVAVKVQRPHIAGCMKTDIDILYHIARIMEKRPEYRNYNPVAVMREFESYTKNELDFEIEARNAARFYRNFENSKTVKIPRPYREISTKRVFISEWLDGTPLSDSAALKRHHVDGKKVVINGIKTIFEMIFKHRFFHADSHPGNLFVMKDKRLGLVDFGIVGHIDEELCERLLRLLLAIIDYDVPMIRDLTTQIAEPVGDVNMRGLTEAIDKIVGEWYGSTLGEMRVTMMFYLIINKCTEFNLKMSADVILLAKALMTMEGTGVELDSRFNFVEETKPLLQKYWKESYEPRSLMKKGKHELFELNDLAVEMPEKAKKVMERFEKGEFGMKIHSGDLSVIREEIDHNSNLRSLAIVFAGLVIAATIASLSPLENTMLGFEVSTLGFVGAGVVGALYFASMIRHKEVSR